MGGKILFIKVLNLLLILFLIVYFLPLSATLSLSLKFYSIIGISMLPTIKEGDTVLTREVGVDEIKVGDIICFSPYNNEGIISRVKEEGIVHRVIEINRNPRLMFLTKGDNNEVADGWIGADFVSGKVIWIIPTRFLFSTTSLIILILLSLVLFIFGKRIFKFSEEGSNIFFAKTKSFLIYIIVCCAIRLAEVYKYYVQTFD